MRLTNKAIIERLVLRIRGNRHLIDLARQEITKVFPPANLKSVRKAEMELGFRLPYLLRDIYTQVANGGIGPGYGLIGVDDGACDDQGHSITELYTFNKQAGSHDPDWTWPERLLPICHWGDAIYSCLDCSQAVAPVIIFDPNRRDEVSGWKAAFSQHMQSFSEWIDAWLNGVDLMQHFLVVLPLNNQINKLLHEGKKVSAILLYQRENLCSLEDAKRAIDAFDEQRLSY